MRRRSLGVLILILVLGLILTGCPKKATLKDEPSARAVAERTAESQRAARIEAEKREKEAAEARMREEERKREEERRKAEAQRELDRSKELERSMVAKKTPGIEGTVFESSLLKDVYFDFDRYEVRPGDAETLRQNAALLAKYAKVKIQIEGHCDERGTSEYNLALGERRANSVKKFLVSLGVAESRISAISYGEEKPADPVQSEEAWAKNRRAHFVITSK
jgi:peptidoglycan-associated lipoprotein